MPTETQEWTAKELYEMAYNKVEEEIDRLMFQRRMTIEKHKQEMEPIERRLVKLNKQRERILSHFPERSNRKGSQIT